MYNDFTKINVISMTFGLFKTLQLPTFWGKIRWQGKYYYLPSKIVSNFGGIRSKFGNKKTPRYDQAQIRAILSQILSARCF